jgi:disulfide bond formation protein DsbB
MAALDRLFRHWPVWAFVISAAALAIAHAFQTFGGLAPCHLCLKQREVYWAALAISAVAVLAGLTRRFGAHTPRIASLILAAVFAYGVYLAAFHAGAEWHWWPAPAACASTGAVSAADLQALLSGVAKKAPACDQAPWRFLGLSMAGWNCLLSAALVGLSLTAAARKPTMAVEAPAASAAE